MYANNTYAPDKGASVSTAVLATGNGAFTALVSSRNVNLGAYWSGSWRSRYSIQVTDGAAKVAGRVQIKVCMLLHARKQNRWMPGIFAAKSVASMLSLFLVLLSPLARFTHHSPRPCSRLTTSRRATFK